MSQEKNNKKLLSLCIPTNGVLEWVQPVIDSIYSQEIEEDLYEVVITDNGDNPSFKDYVNNIVKLHSNLIYKKTDAKLFLNQIEAFNLATGKLIKFINHRMPLVDGSLNYLINFVEKNKEEKPVVYFLNSMLKKEKQVEVYDSFDDFVKGLSYFSSWSAGLTCWKVDYDDMKNINCYNNLFPHTTILFNKRNKGKYCIDNTVIQRTLPTDETQKGKYNLFYAFGVEYMAIILDLFRDSSIKYTTFEYVKNKNKEFIEDLYYRYIIRKMPVSYDFSNYVEYLNVFYSANEIKRQGRKKLINNITKKVSNYFNQK